MRDRLLGRSLCCASISATVFFEKVLDFLLVGFHVTKSWFNMVEVMEGSVTKADAVIRLCHLLGRRPENAVAFGDNYNDEEMLRAVGHGVLMANGPEDLKKRIPFLTEDNDHEGIANELRRIHLIPSKSGRSAAEK